MAFVLSSLSGNLISAASAGYAPTNSADVSAIASAYQVVSATATQLNAGTAYVTSINETPISAERAGNAVNAALANSAWYDGTGRLISALPDESTVSSIASAYAESAASSKQDTLTFDWNADSAISSINGSALAGGGGGVSVQTASARTMYSADAYSGVTGFSGIDGAGPIVLKSGTTVAGAMMMQLGGLGYSPYPSSFDNDKNYKWASGNILLLSGNQGYGYYKGHQLWLCRGSDSTSHRISFDVNNTTADVTVYQSGHSAVITPTGFSIWGPTTNAADRRSIDSAAYDRWNSYSAKQDALVFAYTTDDQISSINGSALAGGGGGIDSATCSAIASSYAESAASSKLDASAASGFYTVDNPSGFITGLPQDITARYITAKNVSASSNVRAINTTADLYGNFDYAGMYFRSGAQRPYNIGIDNTGANFYIATAKNGFERIYASSIQGWNAKLDGSASSSFYTTANESGFINDASASAIASSYVESGVSSKADQSAYDNLYSAFTALNDLISTYSAYFSSISSKVDNSAIGVIE